MATKKLSETTRATAVTEDDLLVMVNAPDSSPATQTVPANVLAQYANTHNGVVNVMDPEFGAVGDGVTDDSAAVQAAITAGGIVVFPPSATAYRIRSRISITAPVTIIGEGATVLFDFPVATSNTLGALFDITASDVLIRGLTVDGTGVSGTITGVNRYAVRVDPSGSTRYSNITLQGMRFTNLTQYSGTIPATTTVMHAVYARQTDNLVLDRCVINTISGAGAFLIDTERTKIVDCDFIKHGWTGVWLNNANRHALIRTNTFSGTTSANPCYYGGAIDAMGQTSDSVLPGEADSSVSIIGNHFDGGVFRYGTVVRLASTQGAIVKGNTFDQCNADQDATAGAGASGSHNHYIEVAVRDVTQNQGPHRNIVISDNLFIPKGAGWQIPIYVITTAGTNTNTTACKGLIVEGNIARAVDASNYFQSFFVLHGFAAGYEGVVIRGNVCEVDPYTVANYQPAGLPGAVVLIANTGKTVSRVIVEGNLFSQVNGAGIGNNDTAVNIYSDVTDVQVVNNSFLNFYRDITVDSGNAGEVPVLPNLHNRAAGGTSWALRGTMFSPVTGVYDLLDGVSAPATVALYGRLYIDTSDGDLKIKFGDGTVKTIVVDT